MRAAAVRKPQKQMETMDLMEYLLASCINHHGHLDLHSCPSVPRIARVSFEPFDPDRDHGRASWFLRGEEGPGLFPSFDRPANAIAGNVVRIRIEASSLACCRNESAGAQQTSPFRRASNPRLSRSRGSRSAYNAGKSTPFPTKAHRRKRERAPPKQV